jgi:hypothetical protein
MAMKNNTSHVITLGHEVMIGPADHTKEAANIVKAYACIHRYRHAYIHIYKHTYRPHTWS